MFGHALLLRRPLTLTYIHVSTHIHASIAPVFLMNQRAGAHSRARIEAVDKEPISRFAFYAYLRTGRVVRNRRRDPVRAQAPCDCMLLLSRMKYRRPDRPSLIFDRQTNFGLLRIERLLQNVYFCSFVAVHASDLLACSFFQFSPS